MAGRSILGVKDVGMGMLGGWRWRALAAVVVGVVLPSGCATATSPEVVQTVNPQRASLERIEVFDAGPLSPEGC